jgi:hypothetical protein
MRIFSLPLFLSFAVLLAVFIIARDGKRSGAGRLSP